METPPNESTESAVNLEDSGCIVDGQRNGFCDEETAMLDHLEMSDLSGSKHSIGGSKSTLKDAGLKKNKKAGMRQVITIKWNDSLERSRLHMLWEKHSTMIVLFFLIKAMLIYSITAIHVSGFLKVQWFFGLTMFLWFCLTCYFVNMNWGQDIYRSAMKPSLNVIEGQWYWLKWFCLVCILAAFGAFLGLDTAKEPERFISLGGLALNVAICWLFSAHRRKVKWRPVMWGLGLQFIFGLLILRTYMGFKAFKGLGNQINIFLEYTNVGASFVFGEKYTDHFFAFKVLPVIVFFSSFISVCYYFGIMQLIIMIIAWVMQVTMGTSAVESLNAAGNIFVGQTEAPLLVRPFLSHVTMSELHAIMTGGFATIAGGVLAAYIGFGVSASHLLSASVMSAPAALAISKLMYPETEIPESLDGDNFQLPRGEERNFIEAAAKGASTAISLVANVAANLIAFLAFLAFFNAVLSWTGSMVGHPEFSFEFICSFFLRPFAFMMGVPWEDCDVVAELLGTKTFLNEFVAYAKLSEFIKNRRLMNGLRTISIRSEIISTYALCGFANLASIGVQLGGLGPMAPERVPDMSRVSVRALVAGTIACFMTACVAGVLYDPLLYEGAGFIPPTVNATVSATLNATLNATVSP